MNKEKIFNLFNKPLGKIKIKVNVYTRLRKNAIRSPLKVNK